MKFSRERNYGERRERRSQESEDSAGLISVRYGVAKCPGDSDVPGMWTPTRHKPRFKIQKVDGRHDGGGREGEI